MRISDIINEDLILADIQSSTKDELIKALAVHITTIQPQVEIPHEQIAQALLDRERLGSTGVGEGVAIPHAKIAGLKELAAGFARSKEGIAFEAIDQKPVHLIFVLLVPEDSAGAHLKALARISRLLKNKDFREQLTTLDDASAIFQAFQKEDEKY
ncbi:PTS sugar transporter subunit IIA [Myxococcota bacterium]|nr:PTS sugar transporter subunit IIA [Myxococcota bacterium]